MSASVSSSAKRPLALTLALAVILSFVAVVVPLAAPAKADHGAHFLNFEPETQTRAINGSFVSLTATLVDPGTGNPRSVGPPVNIDVEVDCITGVAGDTYDSNTDGPGGDPDNCAPGDTGPGGGDESPGTPDMTCDIGTNQSSCTVDFRRNVGSASGQDEVCAWVDEDSNSATFAAERNDAECSSPAGNPTASASEQGTDGVVVDWVSQADARIDLDPEDDTNSENLSHTMSVAVTSPTGTPLAGVDVDWFTSGGAANPHGNTQGCVTGAGGTCNITDNNTAHHEPGTDFYFAWIDQDGVTATEECGGETALTDPENDDSCDGVRKIWVARAGTFLDCTPDDDSNATGTDHNMTCSVLDQEGDPISNVEIDGEILTGGANDADGTNAPPDFEGNTGGDNQITFSYTGNNPGDDEICFWIDANDNGNVPDEGDCGEANPDPDEGDDDTDVVDKTWTGPVATANALDCEPERDANHRTLTHTIDCHVEDDVGNPTAGVTVNVEATGANDPDGANSTATPDFTCGPTDASGDCSFTHDPTLDQVGTTTYRAWVDGTTADATEGRNEETEPGSTIQEPDTTDVVEKTWHGVASTLTLTPESDQAAVGTCNVFTVTMTDSAGRPVGNAVVDIRQTHNTFGPPASDDADVGFCTEAEVIAADANAPNPSSVSEYDAGDDGRAAGETDEGSDADGKVSFGIESDQTGTVEVLAFCEDTLECPNANDNNTPETNELQDISTKTWGAGGADGVENVVCTPDTDTNPAGTTHNWTCTLTNAAGSPIQGVTPVADITAGPNSTEPITPTCDASDPMGVSRCNYTDSGASPVGTDTIEIWVQQSAASGGGTAARDPGEPFDTITKTWTTPPTGLRINLICADDSPRSLERTPGNAQFDEDRNDTEEGDIEFGTGDDDVDCLNRPATANALFTATVTDPQGTGTTTDDTPVSGVQVRFLIDFEENGQDGIGGDTASDIGFVPPGGGFNGPVFCTTGVDGSCAVTVNNPTARHLDFVEVDADIFGQVSPGTFGDSADSAVKAWFSEQFPFVLALTPQGDTNQTGSSHTMTATLTNPYGDPLSGRNVDFQVSGRNSVDGFDRITDANGQATFSYNDGGDPNADGDDTIDAWADVVVENDQPGDTGTSFGGFQAVFEPEDDAVKFWRTQLPTTTNVKLDMQMDDDLTTDDCPDLFAQDDDPTTDLVDEGWSNNAVGPNPVNETHEICAAAFDENNDIIVEGGITFTITSGPGFFTDADGTNLGTTVTVPVDQEGHSHAAINSAQSGTTTVTASKGAVSDSGNKTWFSLPPRTLDCEPEAQSTDPDDTALVECLARDRQGNPVVGWQVFATEQGPGRIQQTGGIACDPLVVGAPDTCVQVTDSQGVAPFTLENPQGTEGEQTLTAELASDDNNLVRASNDPDVDECERPAGNPAGAPAGVCTDTVTNTWDEDVVPPTTDCNDGVDNDGDGLTDFPDDPGCSSAQDDTETGRFRTASRVGIRHKNRPHVFRGAVNSSLRRCERGRRVVVKKVRRGPDRIVGRDRTNRRGKWSTRHRRGGRGRYYARVLRKRFINRFGDTIICLPDRSRRIRVRR